MNRREFFAANASVLPELPQGIPGTRAAKNFVRHRTKTRIAGLTLIRDRVSTETKGTTKWLWSNAVLRSGDGSRRTLGCMRRIHDGFIETVYVTA